LGERRRNIIVAKGMKIWNADIAQHIKEKKQAYWAFLQSNSTTDRTEYKLRS
jgi:hypothetical protein